MGLQLQQAIPSGKHTKNYGTSSLFMDKSTISMAIFNSYFDITRGYMGVAPVNLEIYRIEHH